MGMSHQSAPVSLLERLSMDDVIRNDSTTRLVNKASLSEAMIISTCNRLEVYTVTNSFHTGVQDVVNVLHEVSGVDLDTLRSYLYVRYADAAAEHMLTVASGLDSMVIGEQQIIGQVRSAYQEAMHKGTVGATLHSLTQTALHAGKRVHTETDIDEAGASMVSFALDEALEVLGSADLKGRKALVLGAGAMASLAATHLGRLGVETLIIANRTYERAERLAEHARQAGVNAEVIAFKDRSKVLPEVDIVVSATGADEFTITAGDLALHLPAGHNLMLVDLSLPRDIEPTAATQPGVHLVNIETLRTAHSEVINPDSELAQQIVAEELQSYCSEQRVRGVVPAVAALRRQAQGLVEAELSRLQGRVPDMSVEEFGEVTRTVRRVVDKLLHHPTIKAKELAVESGVVSYETALQEFFGLSSADLEGTDAGRSVAVAASQLPSQDFQTQRPPNAAQRERTPQKSA
ncbi:Glutamyl-tRNA reductase [Corynebacterium caspium DSM 44850]|nr:Glutamyl-tRNA reductase [Corynebacterium caspium DSM 44850]